MKSFFLLKKQECLLQEVLVQQFTAVRHICQHQNMNFPEHWQQKAHMFGSCQTLRAQSCYFCQFHTDFYKHTQTRCCLQISLIHHLSSRHPSQPGLTTCDFHFSLSASFVFLMLTLVRVVHSVNASLFPLELVWVDLLSCMCMH